jgi:hypothetical protein
MQRQGRAEDLNQRFKEQIGPRFFCSCFLIPCVVFYFFSFFFAFHVLRPAPFTFSHCIDAQKRLLIEQDKLLQSKLFMPEAEAAHVSEERRWSMLEELEERRKVLTGGTSLLMPPPPPRATPIKGAFGMTPFSPMSPLVPPSPAPASVYSLYKDHALASPSAGLGSPLPKFAIEEEKGQEERVTPTADHKRTRSRWSDRSGGAVSLPVVWDEEDAEVEEEADSKENCNPVDSPSTSKEVSDRSSVSKASPLSPVTDERNALQENGMLMGLR